MNWHDIEKRGIKLIYKVLKRVYYAAGVVSAVIVIVYLLHLTLVRPPEMEGMAGEEPSAPLESGSENAEPGRLDRKDGCYTLLLLASDASNALADVIMVAMYDTQAQTVGILSIPRDTLVDPDGPGHFPKINTSLQYGVDTLRGIVSDMLGVPIDFYLFVDLEAFVAIVDSIGGVEFDVPVHMSYDDPVQNLHIHYEPGLQKLTGQQALEVCRLRYNDDGTLAYADYDIGRTGTQRAMLEAVARQALSRPDQIPEFIGIWTEYVETDLGMTDMLWFAEQALSFRFSGETLRSAALPGDGNTVCRGVKYCYELDPSAALTLVNDLVNPYQLPRVQEDLNIYQVP